MIAAAATAIAAPIGAEQKAEEKNRKPPPFAETAKGWGTRKFYRKTRESFQSKGGPPADRNFKWVGHPP